MLGYYALGVQTLNLRVAISKKNSEEHAPRPPWVSMLSTHLVYSTVLKISPPPSPSSSISTFVCLVTVMPQCVQSLPFTAWIGSVDWN